MIIICSVWFANTKLQAFPFHIVKKWMYNSGLFCCKSCRQNPIFYSFFLKKNLQKKNFSSKKIQKSKLTNFRFQLDWKPGFRARDKNCKIEKAGRTWLQEDSFTCLLVVSTIHNASVWWLPLMLVCGDYLDASVWWLTLILVCGDDT